MMGHRSITTTEIYAEFPLKKLKSHFPTLLDYFNEGRKEPKMTKVDTFSVETQSDYRAITEGKTLN